MSIPHLDLPPDSHTSYIVNQLEGERITIPGSKGVFRILASSKQTQNKIAVFTSGSTLADAPGFHYHNEAHDVFLVTKGFMKLWNGDQCRIMGPGDFAYIPPNVIHNPEPLGPHTETMGLIAPGDWVDFFRYVSETYTGVIAPEMDDRDLKSLLIPKVMAAKDRFDVQFMRGYEAPEVKDWDGTENRLPTLAPYFLKADTGPRWLLGGVLSRPFIRAEQCGGKFGISSIESSSVYGRSVFSDWVKFEEVDHCFCVQEGTLRARIKGEADWSEARRGETLFIPAGRAFSLEFGSRYVQAYLFTNGKGLEEVVHVAGEVFEGAILPDEGRKWDEEKVKAACGELKVSMEAE